MHSFLSSFSLCIGTSFLPPKMKRNPLPQDYLLNLNMEMILSICSLLLRDDFLAFTNFFQIFVVYKTDEEILNFLHHLDWTNIHVHKSSWVPVVSQRLNQFLQTCTNMRVLHAISYNTCSNLILNNQMNENILVLEMLAEHDHFSYFALNIFKPFFNPNVFQQSARNLYFRFKNSKSFNAQLQSFTESITGRMKLCTGGWDARQLMKPSFPMCQSYITEPAAHFSPYSWPAHFDRVISCKCSYCFLHMLFEIIFD